MVTMGLNIRLAALRILSPMTKCGSAKHQAADFFRYGKVVAERAWRGDQDARQRAAGASSGNAGKNRAFIELTGFALVRPARLAQ